MDPEQLREFEESLRRINELLSKQTETQAALLKGMQAQLNATGHDTTATKLNTDATKKDTEASILSAKMAQAEAEAKQKQAQRAESFGKALGSGELAIKSFAQALLSTERGFTKYGDSISAAGEGVRNFTKEYGRLGEIIGFVSEKAANLLETELQRIDVQLKLKDEFTRLGQVGSGTTSELANLAKQAGYSYQDLHRLSKPIQTAGDALAVLDTAGKSGAKAFLEMADVGRDTRVHFSKFGIVQEELTNIQANYLVLQKQNGVMLRQEAKDKDLLRKNSLAYAENLVTLTMLSGQSIDTAMEQQRRAMQTYEEIVTTMGENERIKQLRAEAARAPDTPESKRKLAEAADIENKQTKRKDMLEILSPLIGSGAAHDYAQIFNSGAITEAQRQYAFQGATPAEVQQDIMSGNLLGMLKKHMRRQELTAGGMYGLVPFLGEAGMTGMLGNKESLEATNALRGKNFDIYKRFEEIVEARKKAAQTEDEKAEAQAVMFETETNTKKIADDALDAFSDTLGSATPLLKKLEQAAGFAADKLQKLSDLLPDLDFFGSEDNSNTPNPNGGWWDAVKNFFGGNKGGGTNNSSGYGQGPFLPGMGPAGYTQGPPATNASKLMAKMAMAESSGDANAKNPMEGATATGLWQFTEKTWLSTVQQMGKNYTLEDRKNPVIAAEVMQWSLDVSQRELKKALGYDPSEDDLYMAHFLGWNNAIPFLKALRKNPGADAAALFPSAAAMNPQVFTPKGQRRRTLAEVYREMSSRLKSGETELEKGAANPFLQQMYRGAPQAANGGVFAGPSSGYPATLHGTEMVAPLQKNSILMQLAKTPLVGGGSVNAATILASVLDKKSVGDSTSPVIRTTEMNDRMMQMNAEMIGMLASKLDTVIDKLDEGNNVSDKLLKRSTV